ncbi:D-alanyl-D-alanine carboxypeptidase DacC [Candidatus Magnetaquicoccaceae bacterium FCR-1]|uniref:serine-type D-Ala-D-Ala carboxypeptidase n=1 Tax=Candidatus Magnetaquiglobus chichijimensis TaxID=3141448 RepID=A0ABQ0CCI0_9PROT
MGPHRAISWVVMLLLMPLLVGVALAADEAPPKVRGTAGLLGDIDSGRVIHAQDVDTRLPPASLTKVMTLYLIYEALAAGTVKLDAELLVSENAWRTGGSKTFVKVGDKVKVEDLIRGIAIQSGNDACVVMAEHLSGSESAFVAKMNAKAVELGLTNTHFTNATGLPDPEHYTSARDLFTLAVSLMRKFPQYSHYSQEKQFTFNGIRQHNRNNLLWRDPIVTGLKTGHTREAGYCLVATSDKEGQRLVAVVMGATTRKIREDDALRLIHYGNRMFETVKFFDAKATVRKLRVWKGTEREVEGVVSEPLVVTVPRKERGSVEVGVSYDEPLVAPIQTGQKIGAVVVKAGGKELFTRDLVAGNAVERGNVFRVMFDSVRVTLGW